MFVTNVGLAVLLATCFAVSAAPHILLLVLDDIGRADTGIHGKSNINLPHLKSLASNGVVFDNFYTQTVCSPTRSSLLTGQYPFRFGMQHFTTQLPGMAAGVPLSLPMLPELLAKKGYERHMIGKWHCGYATWSHTPSKRGFQTYTGYLQAQGDYFKHTFALDQMAAPAQAVDGLDFWHNVRPMFESKGNYSLDIYRDAMTKTLRGYASRQDTAEKRAEHPLFVYLAHQTVHIPLQFRQKEDRCNKIKHATRKIYCYMLIEMDDAIGEMVEEYKSLGMWDDLLILTLTDNGGMVNYAQDKTVAEDSTSPKFPASQGSNYPFRGSKTTMFEGGVRSMAFASGGIIPKDARGRKFSGLAHVVDFSATILSFAGIYPLHKETLRLDGFDLTNVIMNHKGAIEQRDHVPINVVLKGKRYSAVRFGQYKLIVDDFMFPLAQGWFDQDGNLKEAAGTRNEGYMLFDLKDDPEERKDIAAKSPKLVQYGKDLIDMYVKGGSYMEPQNSRRWFPRALPLFHGGAWKPFMSEHKWNEIYAKDTEEIQSALLKEEDDPRIMDVNAILNGPLEIVELDAKDWAPSSGSSAAVEERQTVKKEERNEQVSSVTPADLGESYDEAIVSVKRMRRRLGD